MCDLAEDFGAPSLSISKGRAILTPGLADKLKSGPKFIIRTVSNINKEIRVVAVCGIIDVEEMLLVSDWEAPPDAPELYQEAGQADPSADGWSFSDFYAFRHLLKDIGAAAQFWIVSEPPRELVQRYTAYLHANPYYDRKSEQYYILLRITVSMLYKWYWWEMLEFVAIAP
ncbi:hypothetical protein HBH56_121250 [Parastagonospora nodorum]|nr:hypothetical protein HBH56_121250 [Parastagonospora nodorum]KAH3942555.1 hypothetical protein HBH53_186380 [Parastagonospora nodorum]KAH4011665.1 hypothetical protein HBI13_195200 [Parastagonospora nodorum]KAH4118019.1 hypothetical protein HBH47_144970 [Parastagonospora nodorum]KAH4131941.1 hypothetical protein HBH45_186030 [Parastagonospora nodorum]